MLSERQYQESRKTGEGEGPRAVLAKGVSDKELLSKIYKEFLKLTKKKINTDFLKNGQRI